MFYKKKNLRIFIEAAKKLEAGQSMDMVVNYLEDWFASVELYITGFNLRHMKKSGRIKAAAAFLGELMMGGDIGKDLNYNLKIQDLNLL